MLPRKTARRAPPEVRRDERGAPWTRARVDAAAIAIVARLAPGAPRRGITRGTAFASDLGWDAWHLLLLADPVRRRLHVTVSDHAVRTLRTVGDLADLAWRAMTPDAAGGAGGAALLFVALFAALAPAPALAAPAWGGSLRVGHSYSSARALRQPATFTFLAEESRPTLTALDAGFLYDGPFGEHGGVEAGARVSAGSARPKPARVFGAVARGWWRAGPVWDRLVVSVAGEYLADGGFDAQEGAATAEATLLGGPPGLGRPIHLRKFPLTWRPWIGASYGRAREGAPRSGADAFFRAHARLEVNYARGGSELGLEATTWILGGDAGTNRYVKGALAVPISGALSLVASGESGRQPPRFAPGRRLGVGIGFRL